MAKPRVIISTDIGGSDPDDMESMAHALLASDQWDIQALISTPTKHDGRTSDIHKALDAYTKDYANLKTWSDYPTPAYLKSVVYQGNVNVAPSAGYSSSTEASRAIVDAAHEAKAAGEPLWVMTWGALTDVAQALHDDPSIASTVRVLASNGWNWKQDPNAYEYVVDHAKDGMWMIDSKSTHRGIYVNSEGVEDNSFQMNQVKDHGALGDYFYWARPWGVKMGDSWSIAYLTDNVNNNNPGADSWGGTFVKKGSGNYWTDDTDAAYKIGHYNGAKHVREHQSEIYNDMYKLFNRAKSPNPHAGDGGSGGGSSGGGSSSGGNHPVYAHDDHYELDAGKTMWENSRYLVFNDKGEDGGLKVTSVDKTSAKGVSVSWAADGTIKYTAKSDFDGTDTIGYTVVDADGSSDRGKMVISVDGPTGDGGSGGGTPTPAEGAARVLALGDSHTYGVVGSYGDRESGGFRLHLADKLEDDGIAVDFVGRHKAGPSSFDNQHEGYSGIHIQQLTSKVADMIPATQPDVIMLMAGSNDSAVNSVSQMTSEMSQLIDKLVQHASKAHILIAGIPPVKPDNVVGMKQSVIDGFNAALPGLIAAKAAEGAKVRFVDTSSLKASDISGLDVDKGVHLTHAGHEKLADLWLEALKELGVKDGTLDVDGATTPVPSPGGGADLPVHAIDDHYALNPGQTKWENSRYLTWNDEGGDGKLEVTQVDDTSAEGVNVSWAADGTIVYKAKAGFNGIDTVGYTVVDENGSTSRAKMVFTVGDPSKADPEPEPEPTPGSGKEVHAVDDHYALKSGATKWEAAYYLARNDKGGDGSLKVIQVDDTSENGVSVSFDGKTIVYRSEAGFNGIDTVGYTVVDEDGSTSKANMVFTVGDPSKAEPEPEPDPSTGTGNDVAAYDDHYDLASGATKWEAARYLTWNDKGGDGPLKVTQVDSTSAEGVDVSFDGNTIVYRSKAGFNGTDTIGYTVVDEDGSSAKAKMVFTVGDPSKAEPTPEPDPDPAPAPGGSGEGVVAHAEWYQIDAGKSLWVNSRYFTKNDDGPDGGLEVTAVDAVSANGGRISWVPAGETDGGTTKYTPAADFSGRDSFEYTVVDQDGSSDVGTVFVQVVDVFA